MTQKHIYLPVRINFLSQTTDKITNLTFYDKAEALRLAKFYCNKFWHYPETEELLLPSTQPIESQTKS